MSEQIKELLKLSQENPELEIKVMVDYEVCESDEHNWWLADIGRVEICQLWTRDEFCYIDDEIEDKLYDEWDELPNDGISFEEYQEKRIKELSENKNIEKIIAVYVTN